MLKVNNRQLIPHIYYNKSLHEKDIDFSSFSFRVISNATGSVFTTFDINFKDGSSVLDENALHPDKSKIKVLTQANL